MSRGASPPGSPNAISLLPLAAALFLGVAALCRPNVVSREGSRPLLDTVVTIRVRATAAAAAEEALADAFAEVERVGRVLDWYDTTGVVGRAIDPGSATPVPPELAEVLATALEVSRATAGAYDPTIRPLTSLWGFSATPHVPPEDSIRAALGRVGYARLRLAGGRVGAVGTPVTLDLGGIAKGYAADRAIGVLRAARGVRGGLVAASGDIRVFGEAPRAAGWMIGLAHPRREGSVLARFPLREGAVSTAGDYEQCFFEGGVRYHHIFDPRTGYPARGAASVTVFAREGVLADALDTALLVLGPEAGLAVIARYPGTEAVWIVEGADGLHEVTTPGLAGRIEFDWNGSPPDSQPAEG